MMLVLNQLAVSLPPSVLSFVFREELPLVTWWQQWRFSSVTVTFQFLLFDVDNSAAPPLFLQFAAEMSTALSLRLLNSYSRPGTEAVSETLL